MKYKHKSGNVYSEEEMKKALNSGMCKSEDFEEMEDEEETKKSLVAEQDFIKSLEALEATIDHQRPRKDVLLEKSMAKTASPEEEVELAQLLKSGVSAGVVDAELEDRLAKSWAADEIKDAMDISPFLKTIAEANAAGFDAVKDALYKSAAHQRDFSMSSGRAILQMGRRMEEMQRRGDRLEELVKSQNELLEQLGRAPVGVRRSPPHAGAARTKALKKSVAGTAGEGEITAGQRLDACTDMLSKGITRTDRGEQIEVISTTIESGLLPNDAALQFVDNHAQKMSGLN